MLQVGLCRQNADATVNVPREPLRFHGLVVLYSFRHESRHKKKSPRPHVGAKCGMCRASSEGYCCCTQTNKGPNTLRALATKTTKHMRNTSTETEKPTRTEGQTKNRPRTTSIDREKGDENSQYTCCRRHRFQGEGLGLFGEVVTPPPLPPNPQTSLRFGEGGGRRGGVVTHPPKLETSLGGGG